jgi:hypothetical protein
MSKFAPLVTATSNRPGLLIYTGHGMKKFEFVGIQTLSGYCSQSIAMEQLSMALQSHQP